MKHIKLFENWSANFHNTLQGAYAKAKETGLRHGKAAKDIEDYVSRNISTERFTVFTKNDYDLVISYREKFLLEPLSVLFGGQPTMLVLINEKGGQPVEPPLSTAIKLENGKLISSRDNIEIRFRHRTELEDFIAMYVQAVISDRTGNELPPDVLSAAGYTENAGGEPGITSSPTKNFLLQQVNDVLQKDIRNLL